jgi:hypothetical protein
MFLIIRSFWLKSINDGNYSNYQFVSVLILIKIINIASYLYLQFFVTTQKCASLLHGEQFCYTIKHRCFFRCINNNPKRHITSGILIA